MKAKNDKRETLMLVGHPRILLSTLCYFKESIATLSSFKQHLEKSMKRTKPIHIKTAHTYFYTATTYKLLLPVEGQKGVYRVSETGKYICGLLDDPSKKEEYRKALRSILLSNPRKGHLFQEFLDFVKNTATEKEIYKRFQTPTGKTLIAWRLEAGLVLKHGKFVAPLKPSKKSPTEKRFWEEMLSVYEKMQQTSMLRIKRLLVGIDELRLRVSCSLNFEETSEFDRYLKKLLETDLKRRITLYGAPSHMLADTEKTFLHNGKIYAYISLKKDEN